MEYSRDIMSHIVALVNELIAFAKHIKPAYLL
jgi:hypothetical protein